MARLAIHAVLSAKVTVLSAINTVLSAIHAVLSAISTVLSAIQVVLSAIHCQSLKLILHKIVHSSGNLIMSNLFYV
ncbi:hypothetical protein ACMGD3_12705 [Lysinibacillus sphaericus]|uniref:hypothetical protein n=1 Tax=Lysinibacillus sphaericus TaxID=1421 RepID=UPI003F7B31FF